MSINYILAANAEELDSQISAAIESASTMRERVQIAAVSILAHAEKHGDYTRAAILVDGLGEGVNQRALVEFFVKFGGLIVDEEDGGFNGWTGAEFIKEHFQDAKGTMWYTLKPLPVWSGYSLEDALNKVVNQHLKHQKKLNALPADDPARKKFEMSANRVTLERVLGLVDMELIVNDNEQSQDVDAELEAELKLANG